MKKITVRRILTVSLLLSVGTVSAQGDGGAGIAVINQMVTSYFNTATKLIYAIGAIVGLWGCKSLKQI